jgi:hypothetical protein
VRFRIPWAAWLRRNKRDYCEVFGSEAGKRVLRNIIRESGFQTDPFVPGDPSHTTYFVGRHWIVRHIRSVMGMTEEELESHAKLLEEQEQQQERTYT